MFVPPFKLLMCLAAWATVVNGYKSLTDAECFKKGASQVLEEHLQQDDFVKDLEAFKGDHFMTVVRYCLGPDGSASSTAFIKCLGQNYNCKVDTTENIDWQHCVCSTIMCTMSQCLQTWLQERGITSFSCAAPCAVKFNHCLGIQLGYQH